MCGRRGGHGPPGERTAPGADEARAATAAGRGTRPGVRRGGRRQRRPERRRPQPSKRAPPRGPRSQARAAARTASDRGPTRRATSQNKQQATTRRGGTRADGRGAGDPRRGAAAHGAERASRPGERRPRPRRAAGGPPQRAGRATRGARNAKEKHPTARRGGCNAAAFLFRWTALPANKPTAGQGGRATVWPGADALDAAANSPPDGRRQSAPTPPIERGKAPSAKAGYRVREGGAPAVKKRWNALPLHRKHRGHRHRETASKEPLQSCTASRRTLRRSRQYAAPVPAADGRRLSADGLCVRSAFADHRALSDDRTAIPPAYGVRHRPPQREA